MSTPIILILVLGAIIVSVIAFWARYVTAGADEAIIITGSGLGTKNVVSDETGRKMKIIRGGGTFVIPIIQQMERISLLSHQLDVHVKKVYSKQGVAVNAIGVAIIKVDGTNEGIATAAEQFLGKSSDELKKESIEVLSGHLRGIIGTLTVEEVNNDRTAFAEQALKQAQIDLHKMGLNIVSFTIKDFWDDEGYLDSLGKARIAAVKRDAEIAESEAIRDARIKKAANDQDAKQAEIARDTNVAEFEKEKELKIAAFKKEQDRAKAEANMSYSIQEAISQQQVKEEEMKIKLVEKQKLIELEEKEIQRREKQYDAEVKKKADADKYAVEQAAEAAKKKQILEAEAKKYQIEAEGQALAEAEKAKGTAEAEVVRLRGLAEAEAKEKLAQAYEKFGEAAILSLMVDMLPKLAHEVAQPMSNIDKVTVIDGGSGDGVTRFSHNATKMMAQLPEMLKDVSGFDLNGVLNNLIHKNQSMPSLLEDVTKPVIEEQK